MGSVSLYTVKQHNLPSKSISTSLRMKIAVLFPLVVLLLVAFLKPASGCDCVKFLSTRDTFPATLAQAGVKNPACGKKEACAKAACANASADVKKLIKGYVEQYCTTADCGGC